jgi:hypothetical protein
MVPVVGIKTWVYWGQVAIQSQCSVKYFIFLLIKMGRSSDFVVGKHKESQILHVLYVVTLTWWNDWIHVRFSKKPVPRLISRPHLHVKYGRWFFSTSPKQFQHCCYQAYLFWHNLKVHLQEIFYSGFCLYQIWIGQRIRLFIDFNLIL